MKTISLVGLKFNGFNYLDLNCEEYHLLGFTGKGVYLIVNILALEETTSVNVSTKDDFTEQEQKLLSKILKKLYAAKDNNYTIFFAKKESDNIIRLLEKIKTINPSNRAYDEYFSEEEIAIFDNFLTYFNLADFGIIGSKWLWNTY